MIGPKLVFWEVTEKCNLKCPYCRRQGCANTGAGIEEYRYIVDSIAENFRPILVLSGGEPLLYPHIFEIAAYAKEKSLTIALATNAALIDGALARRIGEVGFHRVAVSLDGAAPETNDSIRGEGAFAKTMGGIRHLEGQGVELQINVTVMRRNFKEIPLLYNLCLRSGIKALHIFAFVPAGCGLTTPKSEALSKTEYEDFLDEMAELSLRRQIEIKLTCAPHYNRILSRKRPGACSPLFKGCLAGSGVCFISARGDVYPCGYLPVKAGNVFRHSFGDIWESSPLFLTLRDSRRIKGKCGDCEYLELCSGCRARAFAATGDYLEEEPECVYQPLNARS